MEICIVSTVDKDKGKTAPKVKEQRRPEHHMVETQF